MLDDYPIVARNITFKVGFRKTIIENISLVVEKNEFVGLIGGSGSGKTTLLTCLNGFRECSDGSVFLNGIPVSQKEKTRRLIGYVPQDDIVHKTLTVERALYYSCLLRLDPETPEDKIEYLVGKVLYRLDLRDHRNKKIRSLSGGQRKRVSIGIELLHSPSLFFLDEPTAGLDPALERKLMRLLATLADEGRAIIITTHLMQNIELFDTLIFLHKGRLIYFGPSSEIKSYFNVSDMIDLFERVLSMDPVQLSADYASSPISRSFLQPRMMSCSNVR